MLSVILYKICMADEKFFLNPVHDWQRRYEALRASFVDRLPARVVADRFGYSPAYINLLRHQFTHDKIDFSEPVPEGKVNRRAVDMTTRQKICSWREHRLASGEITQLLCEEGIEISVRTVERVLAELATVRQEGFAAETIATKLNLEAGSDPSIAADVADADLFLTLCDATEIYYQMSTDYVAERARGVHWSGQRVDYTIVQLRGGPPGG